MRVRRTVLAIAALSAASVAQAQPSTVQPDEDLKCAAWAAVVVGANQDKPEVVNAFSIAFAWFLARYEGATGRAFEQNLSADYLDSLAPELQEIEKICMPRMQEMGTRMTEWGQKIQSSAK